ncbi:MAG: hypothetical protein E4H00_10225 [Myxococcales bacterium]|nr:MAG: hypothetical protein E4H00_10225 [Myxococcales bacterium]
MPAVPNPPDVKWPYRFACPDSYGEIIHYITDPDRSEQISYRTFAKYADLAPMRDADHPAMYRISSPENWAISFHKSKMPSGMPIVYFDWSRIEHVFSPAPIDQRREYELALEEKDRQDRLREARSNPLLAKPAVQHHRLREESRLTKFGWRDVDVGVHTATLQTIAAGYAYSATEKNGFLTYPVVYTLMTGGLKPEPDVDALLWWYESGGIEQATEFLEYGEYEPIHDDETFNNPLAYAIEVLPNQARWHEVAYDGPLLELALKGDRYAVGEVLVKIFPQRRYLQNFELSRVIDIRSFRLWHSVVQDEEEHEGWSREAQKAQENGFMVMTAEDMYAALGDDLSLEWKTLWTNPEIDSKAGRRGHAGKFAEEFHGASGAELQLSFPELGLIADDAVWGNEGLSPDPYERVTFGKP